MNQKLKKLSVLILCSFPLAVMAHPGHGHSDADTIWHYLGEFNHALPIAGAVAMVALLLWTNLAGKKEKAN